MSPQANLKLPLDNIGLWLTKLRSERKSERTIILYEYLFRHFYATEMLRNGAKLEVVGRILEHSSIGITADIYRHVGSGEMHEEHLRFAPLNGVKTLKEVQ